MQSSNLVHGCRTFSVLAVVAACTLGAASTSFGQTSATFTGAISGTWSNSANWSALPTNGIATTLTFGSVASPANLSLTNDLLTMINSLVINRTTAAQFTIGGNDLTFAGTGAQILFQGTGAALALTQTINSNIILGGSTLSIVATSTNNNILRIGGNISNSTGGLSVLTLSGSSTGANTIVGIISDTNGIVGGQINLNKDGLGLWILANSNTFTGVVSILNGTLRITHTQGLGAGNLISFGAGANAPILSLSTAVASAYSLTQTIALNGGTGSTATIQTDNAVPSTTVTLAGLITATGAGSKNLILAGTNTGANLVTGRIVNGDGTLGLIKNGVGTWGITNSTNTFTGGVTILGGVLRTASNSDPLGGLNMANNNLVLSVTAGTVAVVETTGTITNALGTGANQIQWRNVTTSGGGGFAAFGGQLDLNFGNSTNTLTWNSTAGFISGTNNEIQLGSNTADSLVNFNNNIALNTTTNRTIRIWDNAAVTTDMSAVTGVISGVGSGLNITGTSTGKLILSGANTYDGGTTIGAALDIAVRNNAAFGTGLVTITAGLLEADTMAPTLANNFLLRGNLALTGASGNAITLGGNITLTNNALISSSNTTATSILSGGTIYLGADVTTARTLTLGAAAGGTLRVDSTITNGTNNTAGSVAYSAAGTVVVNGVNAYSGSTTLGGGTVIAGNDLAFGTSLMTIAAGTLRLESDRVFANNLSLGGSAFFAGTGNLTFDGPGIDVVTAGFTFSNNLSGTIAFNNEVRLGSNISITSASGGIVSFAGGISVTGADRQITSRLVSGVNIGNINLAADNISHLLNISASSGRTITVDGVISDGSFGGKVTLLSAGTVVLNNTNTFSGGLTLSAGTAVLSSTKSLGTGTLTLLTGQISLSTATSVTNVIVLGGGNVTISGQNQALTLSSGQQVIVTGSSTLTFSNLSAVAINDSIRMDSNLSLSSAAGTVVTLNGNIGISGAVAPTRFLFGTNVLVNGNVNLALDATAHTLTFVAGTIGINGVVSDGGVASGLNNLGATLTLSNANTYGGGTTLAGGTAFTATNGAFSTGTIQFLGGSIGATGGLQTVTNAIVMNGNGGIGVGSSINLNGTITVSGGNRQLSITTASPNTVTLNNIALGESGQARALTLSSVATGLVTIAGSISQGAAGGSITYVGGNYQLNSAQAYTGGTTIGTTATVAISDAGAFGTGNITFSTSGNLNINSAMTVTNNIVLIGNAGFGGTNALNLSGTIAVSGGNRQISTTNTGGVTLTSILLGVGGANTLTLAGAATGTAIVNGVISEATAGSGVALAATGNWQFNNANLYTGGTTLTAGTLVVGASGALGTGTLTFTGGILSATNGAQTVTNNIVLLGTANFSGATAITLSNVTVSAAARQISLTNSALTTFNNIVLGDTGGARTLTLAGAATSTGLINGVISEPATGGNLAIAGGNWTIANASTFSGTTSIQGGVLVIGAAGALGTGSLIVSGGSIGVTNGVQTVTNNINALFGTMTTTGSSTLTFTGSLTTITSRSIITNNTAGTVFNNIALNNTTTPAIALTFGGTGNATIMGVVSQAISGTPTLGLNITNTGGAVVTLLGNSTFTGSTTVGANAIAQFGDGTSNNGQISGTLFVTVGTGAARFNYSGMQAFTGITITGGGNVVVNSAAAGGVIYNSAMNYSGSTQINTGTLSQGITQALTNTSALFINSTGTLDLNGLNLTLTTLNDVSGTGGYVTASSGTPVLTLTGGVFRGTLNDGGGILALTKTGAGILQLGGNNNFTGLSTLGGGTTIIGSNTALGGATINVATLTNVIASDTTGRTINNNFNLNSNLVIGGTSGLTFNGTITNSGGDRTITVTNGGTTTLGNLVLSDVGATSRTLTITGTGALNIATIADGGSVASQLLITNTNAGGVYITGANAYVGSTSIGAAAAKLVLGSNTALGSSTLVFGVTGGSVQSDTTGRSLANGILTQADALFTGTQALAFSGTVTNAVSGARAFTANNSGGTTLGSMVMQQTLTNSTVFTFNGNSSLTVGAISVGTSTAGAATISNNSAGGVTFAGNNSYGGITTVVGGATLNIGAGGTSGNVMGLIALTSATGGRIVFNRSDIAVFGAAASTTAVISGSGSVTVASGVNGGIQFNAVQTYAGLTTIEQGYLKYGINNAFPVANSLRLNTSGTVDLNGFAGTIATLSDGAGGGGYITSNVAGGVVTLNNGAFSGTITGGSNLSVVKGAGVLMLTGSNSFSNTSTIGAGTLQVGHNNALGTAAWTLNNGATIQGTGGARTIANNFLIPVAGAAVTIAQGDGDLTFSGIITNSLGANTMTILNSGFTTTLNTIVLNNGILSGSTIIYTINVADNANLNLVNISQGSGTRSLLSLTGNVGGSGSIVTIIGANTYTGVTTVGGNVTLSLAGSNRLASNMTFTLMNTATLALGGNQTFTNLLGTANTVITNSSGGPALLTLSSGTFSGLIKDGNGVTSLSIRAVATTLTLANDNTYTGVTTVGAGVLALGSGGATGNVGGTIVLSGTGGLTWNRTSALTFNNNITATGIPATMGVGVMTFTGGGQYTLNGYNIWNGATTVGGSTSLTLGANTTLSNLAAITITNGAVPGTGGSLTLLSGAVVGTGAITLGTGATLNVNSGVILGTGVATANAGNIVVGANSTFIFDGQQGTASTQTSSITLAAGAILQGSGQSFSAQVTASNGSDIFIGTNATVSTLTLRSLILAGGSMNFTFSSGGTTAGVNNDLLRLSSTAAVTAPTVFNLNDLGATGAGTYTLISGLTSTISGSGSITLAGLNAYSKTLFADANTLQIILASVSTKTWDGAVDNIWDVATTANWSGAVYNQLESVTFIDGAAQADITLSNNGVAITPNAILVNNGATTYTFRGDAIGGATGLDKQGTGLLVLANDNTFTGAINVSGGGTLQIGEGTGTGSITPTLAIMLENNSTIVFNRTGTITQTGNITGSGNLIKRGAGTLSLNGVNAYTGGTTITGDTLQVAGTGVLSSFGAYSVFGGTLGINGTAAQIIANTVTVSNGGLINVVSQALTTSTLILNNGTLNITGSTLTTPTLIITDGSVVNITGILAVTSSVALQSGTINTLTNQTLSTLTNLGGGGAGSQAVVNIAAGTTLTIGANIGFDATGNPLGAEINGPGALNFATTTTRSITVGNSTSADNDLTINAVLSSSSSFGKFGQGALYLTGTNLLVNTNTLSVGTLRIGNNAALGTGQLLVTGTSTGTNAAILAADNSARNLTNTINLAGSLVIGGTQNLTLATMTVNGASRRVNFDTTNDAVTTIQQIYLAQASLSSSFNFVAGGAGNVIINSLSDVPSATTFGNLSLGTSAGLSMTLANANSYGGFTTVAEGSLYLGNALSLGVSTTAFSVNLGTADAVARVASLLTTAPITITRSIGVISNTDAGSMITIGGATSDSSAFTGAVSYAATSGLFLSAATSGTVVFAGGITQGTLTAGGITKTGAGTVILTGSTTYTNTTTVGTTIHQGTLRLGSAGALATTPILKVNTGAVLDLNGNNVSTIQLADGLSGGGSIGSATTAVLTVSNGSFSGIISDAVSLSKLSAGTLILVGNNTFTGTTTIGAGTLQIGDGVANSGGLLGGGNIVNSGTLAFNRVGSTTVGGVISGGGLVTITAGNITFTNDNTYTGATTIASGSTLQVQGANASTTINSLGTLQFFTNSSQTFGGVLAGSGFLEKLGSGTTYITGGSNSFNGITTVSAGTLSLANPLSGSIYVTGSGSLVSIGGSGAVNVSGGSAMLTGAQTGSVTLGGGSLTVSGGSLSGAVSVVAGVLSISNSTVSGTTFAQTGGVTNFNAGSSLLGTLTQSGGTFNLNSNSVTITSVNINGGTFAATSGVTLSTANTNVVIGPAGTLYIATGATFDNGGATFNLTNGTMNVTGTANSNLHVLSGATLQGGHYDFNTSTLYSGNITGTVTVDNGGILSIGGSVGDASMANLSLTGGAVLDFEFRNATGSVPGQDWDHIDLGASGILDLGDADANDRITINIDSWMLDNVMHGGGVSDGANYNNFNPNSTYEWLFIQVASLANLTTNGTDDNFSRRFNIVDNLANAGVFDIASGNPFNRPISGAGQGTFTAVWTTISGKSGLYIHYSAVPEPGSMILAGLASLGAGWYGRRRKRREAAAAQTAATVSNEQV